jgi:gamma-D-glutamyl-L-lysine dipeptidyl-peptidase
LSTINKSIAICHVSAANVMKEASHYSALETQILFGEAITITEIKNNWCHITANCDGYNGWVLLSQFTIVPQLPTIDNINSFTPSIAVHNQHSIYLPAGASLPNCKNNQVQIGDSVFTAINNCLQVNQLQWIEKNIQEIVHSYRYVPYVWGGRTHAGIDCSGFSAMLYKYFNLPLKHEATWQSKQGTVVDFLQQAVCGDLAFFDDEEGDITHVGIMLNNAEIIHATETAGGVTIDDIDNAGIISRLTGKRTHQLRVIKRLL